jgi:pimeloyl-ACP methyl ester carboxylesterase
MHTVRRGPNATQLAVYEQGEGPAVVFSHGFPELAFSWRYQLPALAAAGFRAIAPDQRGYGGSSRPEAIEDYSIKNLAADFVGMLDALEIDKAIFVGHDWGGPVAWSMPLLYPERTLGVIGVCTPYVAFPSTDIMRAMTGGNEELFYMLWFQKPGVAEAVMDPKVHELMEKMLRKSIDPAELLARMKEQEGPLSMNPFLGEGGDIGAFGDPLVSPEELKYYVSAFERTGFRGGINWYRNVDRNLEEVPALGQAKLDLPCLMLTAEWDLALRPEMAAGMPALIDDLELHMIPKAGHWVQQEAPELVNGRILDWLNRRFKAAGEHAGGQS